MKKTPADRQEESEMISAIILLLAVLTAGSILGTFVIAILELNAIDEIPAALAETQEALNKILP